MTITEPGEYILVEPKGPGAMVLAFTRTPDGRIQHHYYGPQDSPHGVRLMEALGVDTRNYGPTVIEQEANRILDDATED